MENPNGQNAGGESGDGAERLRRSASEALSATKDAAARGVEEQGAKVMRGVHTTADSLRRAAADVEGDQAWMSTALRKTADGLEAASQSLSGGDVEGAVSKLNDFARNQPALFLGASVALGFALARIGKTAMDASSPPSTPNTMSTPTPGM